jgi:hypothetical protein
MFLAAFHRRENKVQGYGLATWSSFRVDEQASEVRDQAVSRGSRLQPRHTVSKAECAVRHLLPPAL